MGNAIALVAAVAAVVSLYFVARQVSEAKNQTRLQREIMESASQPYIWVDLRVERTQAWFILLVIGNSGPTVATNVRVDITPPFPAEARHQERASGVQAQLSRGLSSIAPGRELQWNLGASHELVGADQTRAHRIKISYDGPYGPVPATEYVFDVDDFKDGVTIHRGSLHLVGKELQSLTRELQRLRDQQQTHHDEERYADDDADH